MKRSALHASNVYGHAPAPNSCTVSLLSVLTAKLNTIAPFPRQLRKVRACIFDISVFSAYTKKQY